MTANVVASRRELVCSGVEACRHVVANLLAVECSGEAVYCTAAEFWTVVECSRVWVAWLLVLE